MQITILTQYYPPEIGAAQVRLSSFAKNLVNKGHQVEVVTAMPNYPAGEIYAKYRGRVFLDEYLDGISIRRSWIYAATGKNVARRLANYFSFVFTSFWQLLRAHKADIVFVESPPLFLCLSAWLVSVVRQQKLCINISDLWPDSVVTLGVMNEGLLVRAARALELWLYRRAWRVSAVTKGMLDMLRNKKHVSNTKLLFLPNGVDLDHFTPAPRDSELCQQYQLEGKSVFIYAGLHGYAQGLDIILDAAEQLRENKKIVFMLVGDGPEKSRLMERASQINLGNAIFVDAQPVTLMPRYFSLATASIVPLLNRELFKDARPSKIFPALGCAKPVIYCGFGESAELIVKAHAGIVTEPENAGALAQAVLALASDWRYASELGRNGRNLVESHYSWSSIVDQWISEIEK